MKDLHVIFGIKVYHKSQKKHGTFGILRDVGITTQNSKSTGMRFTDVCVNNLAKGSQGVLTSFIMGHHNILGLGSEVVDRHFEAIGIILN